jgi:hypothetical protein
VAIPDEERVRKEKRPSGLKANLILQHEKGPVK